MYHKISVNITVVNLRHMHSPLLKKAFNRQPFLLHFNISKAFLVLSSVVLDFPFLSDIAPDILYQHFNHGIRHLKYFGMYK